MQTHLCSVCGAREAGVGNPALSRESSRPGFGNSRGSLQAMRRTITTRGGKTLFLQFVKDDQQITHVSRQRHRPEENAVGVI